MGLLRYVMSDLRDPASGGWKGVEFIGLPLLPLADGTSAYFSALASHDEESALAALNAMGFSEQQCRAGLFAAQKQLSARAATQAGVIAPPNDLLAAAATWLVEATSGSGADAAVSAVINTTLAERGPWASGSSLPVFTASPAQRAVLQRFVPKMIVASAAVLGEDLSGLLSSESLQCACNVRSMCSDDVASLLPKCVPRSWLDCRKQSVVGIDTGPDDVQLWLQSVWSYLRANVRDLGPFAATSVPLLPTMHNTLARLLPHSASTVLISPKQISEDLVSTLECLGLALTDFHSLDAVMGQRYSSDSDATADLHPDLWRWVQPGDWRGFLRAVYARSSSEGVKLSPSQLNDSVRTDFDTSHLPAVDRERLLAWLVAESRVGTTATHPALNEQERLTLRCLPLFRAFPGTSGATAAFYISLEDDAIEVSAVVAQLSVEIVAKLQLYWPSARFLMPESSESQSRTVLLNLCGTPVLDLAEFSLRYVLTPSEFRSFPAALRDAVVSRLLAAAGSGQLRQCSRGDEAILALSRLPCVPILSPLLSATQLRCPCELFDPTVPILVSLLDPGSFPAVNAADSSFADPTVLAGLRLCGMRSQVDREGLLASARSIEEQSRAAIAVLCSSQNGSGSSGEEDAMQVLLAAAARGVSLLSYLRSHATELFSLPPLRAQVPKNAPVQRPAGFFARVAAGVAALGTGSRSTAADLETQSRGSSDNADEDSRLALAAEISSFVSELKALAWVPVYVLSPVPFLPWPAGAADATYLLRFPPLVQPPVAAPISWAWFVSVGVESVSEARCSRILYEEDDFGVSLQAQIMQVIINSSRDADEDAINTRCLGPAIFESLVSPFRLPSKDTAPERRLLIPSTTVEPLFASLFSFSDSTAPDLSPISAAYQLRSLAETYISVSAALRVKSDGAWGMNWLAIFARHVESACITDLYRAIATASDFTSIRSVLPDTLPVIWVGSDVGFAPARHVAFRLPLLCAPYLFAVPSSSLGISAALRVLGVRDTFTSSDFIDLLTRLARDTGWVHLAEAEPVERRVLSQPQLELAVMAVQRIADAFGDAPDPGDKARSVWVPDSRLGMSAASELVYDDATWLDSTAGAELGSYRFVHPTISNTVASTVGATSLRRRLLASHASLLPMSVPSEAFGQAEPLTRRLRSIIEMYPEGAGTLHEMTQNADDAGATRVCFFFNLTSYGTTSLLAPSMAPWQGPALLVYNDSMFSPQDWQNLARIGQGKYMLYPGFRSTHAHPLLPACTKAIFLVLQGASLRSLRQLVGLA
jgi:hypothetical protein